MNLGLDVALHDGHAVLAVIGEVDLSNGPRLREAIIDLVNRGERRIVVDLTGVEFLDSTGLGILVGGLKRVRSHDGNFALVCSRARILKVFEITGLDRVFAIFDSVEAATAS
ncbi:MAG: STAS domain-containing protein [Acidimicrobiia bacterium]